MKQPVSASNDRGHSFFKITIGQSARDKENALSRLFRACFSESKAFAEIMLTTIWREAKLSGPVPTVDGWKCDYQSSTPVKGHGRLDLILSPPVRTGARASTSHKPIHIESKVGSKLGAEQLKRYKVGGAKILVAITKNWPEVSQHWLNKEKIKSLRWQDMCRALRQTSVRGQKDRFLCVGFAAYLEESDMAYREDIKQRDLEIVRSLLVNVASQNKEGEIVPRAAFETADDVMQLFEDARRLVRERLPKFAWSKWGPAYYHEFDENDEKIAEHALGFGFYKNKRGLYCYVYFPVEKSEPIYFWLWLRRPNKKP